MGGLVIHPAIQLAAAFTGSVAGLVLLPGLSRWGILLMLVGGTGVGFFVAPLVWLLLDKPTVEQRLGLTSVTALMWYPCARASWQVLGNRHAVRNALALWLPRGDR